MVIPFRIFSGSVLLLGLMGTVDRYWYDEFQLMGQIKTFNILIKSFGKAAMYKKMGSVLKFKEKLFFASTVVTYNIVTEILGKAGKIEKMEEYFKEMKLKGVKPDAITYCSIVSVYRYHLCLR